MKVIDVNEFYRELKKYPIEMGFCSKQDIVKIIKNIQFDIDKQNKTML